MTRLDDTRRVRAAALPAESRLAPLFGQADLADAFAIALPAAATRDIEALARAVLGRPAPWVRALLRLRDLAMGSLGVKTSRRLRDEAAAGDTRHIDFFRIRERSERELVVGEDDSHLDFRASVLLRARPGGAGDEVVATTVVQCHNRLGRAYIAVIAPFHRRVVRSGLRRAARRGWPAGGAG